MKSFKLVLAFAMCALCLFSCSEEEEDNVTPDTGIVGNWLITEVSYGGSSTSVVQGVSSTYTFTGTGTDLNLKAQFSENPNDFTSSGSYNVNMEMKYGEQTMESEWPSAPFLLSGSWSVDGEKLIIVNANGDEQEANILSLTETTLELAWNFSETTSLQGVSSTYDIEGVYVFTKE